MRRTIALLPLVLVIVAGCGGDDDDSTETVTVGQTATTEPLTKAEYIEQGDAICREGQEITDDLQRDFVAAAEAEDYQAAASAIEQLLAEIQPRYDRLAALPKPEGDEKVLGQIDRGREQNVVILERVVDALRDEDDSRIAALFDEIESLGDQIDGIETGYGFKVCGQGD